MLPPSEPADPRVALTLAELDAQVIALEAAHGLSIPGAVRPLHSWERHAAVRFGDLERRADKAAGEIVRLMRASRLEAAAVILADLHLSADSAALLHARITNLASPLVGSSVSGLRPIVDTLRDAIVQLLLRARDDAIGDVIGEATRQGLAPALLAGAAAVPPTATERAGLVQVATHLATIAPARILDAAAAEARARLVGRASVSAALEAIATTVEGLGEGGWADEARQGVTRAINAGRQAAAAAAPDPVEIYASELLDKNTCAPCAEIDGRMYESLAAAFVDYPSGGSYGGCLGRARCRGTLVYVWEAEQAPTLDQGSFDRMGRFPIDRTPMGPSLAVDDPLDGIA